MCLSRPTRRYFLTLKCNPPEDPLLAAYRKISDFPWKHITTGPRLLFLVFLKVFYHFPTKFTAVKIATFREMYNFQIDALKRYGPISKYGEKIGDMLKKNLILKIKPYRCANCLLGLSRKIDGSQCRSMFGSSTPYLLGCFKLNPPPIRKSPYTWYVWYIR